MSGCRAITRRAPPADLSAALETYLDHLRVERGLSAATIRAYDADLRAFGGQAPGIERWADRARACARAISPRLGRPPRRAAPVEHPAQGGRHPRLLPASAPARSSSTWTSPTGWTCRAPRVVLPDTLDVDEVEALLEATAARQRRRASATGRCWSCCMRPGCGSARRSGSTWRTCRPTPRSVRVIGKGDRERVVPVGDVASRRSSDTSSTSGRPWLRHGRGQAAGRARGGPLFLSPRGRRLGRMEAWRVVQRSRRAGRDCAAM